MSKILREAVLSRDSGEQCRIEMKETVDGRIVVGAYVGVGYGQPSYLVIAGDEQAISGVEGLRAFNDYQDQKLTVGWIVTPDFSSNESFGDVDRLFGAKLVYSLKRGGGGQRAMRRSIAILSPPADIYAEAEHVMSLPQTDARMLEDVGAFDFPFVLHFAMAGILTIKRNGRTLDDGAMSGLASAAQGRARKVLEAFGRVDAVIRDFSLAIGVPSNALVL